MAVIQNITTGLSNTKSPSYAIDNGKRMAVRRFSTIPLDKVDIQHATLSDSSNYTHTLDAGSGQKAIFTFSQKTSEVSVLLVSKDGISKAVSQDNLPKDLKMIKTLDSFNGFLENAQARGTVLSDGEAKIYVAMKGLGGSGRQGSFNPVGPNGPMQPPEHGTNGLHSFSISSGPSNFASGLNVGIHGSAHSIGSGFTVGTVGAHATAQNHSGLLSAHITQSVVNGHKPATSVGVGGRLHF